MQGMQPETTGVGSKTASHGGQDVDLGVDTPKVNVITKKTLAERQAVDADQTSRLADRAPEQGNPQAKLADPVGQQVVPRYDIVQNRSDKILIFPDLRNATNPEDRGLSLNPGEVIKLTDFYTPMEINRSKGLRKAATDMAGVAGQKALVMLKSEDEGANFIPPKKAQHNPGDNYVDDQPNDFDLRFEELEERDAKREQKLMQKTLGQRRLKIHGQAPSQV